MRWKSEEENYLFENIHKLPLPDIARHLNRSEMAVSLYLHRHRNESVLCENSNNLLHRILEKKFKDVTFFLPNRKFFNAVKIGQKRYWAIYKGRSVITEEELIRVANYFEISLEDFYTVRQTSLF